MTALDLLLTEPRRFRLGSAVRLLGLACGTDDPLAGGDRDAAAVRVSNRTIPAVALAEVEAVTREPDGRFTLVTPVLNVVGVTGVFPHSDWMAYLDRAKRGSPDWTPFDRITHRLVAVWYGAWRRYAECGTGAAAAVGAPLSLSRFAALFARVRSAAGLESLLSGLFQVPVRVGLPTSGWTTIEHDVKYDTSRYCRIEVGPLPRARFEELLPRGPRLGEFLRTARAYAGPVPRFEVLLRLRAADVRAARFDESDADRGAVLDGGDGRDVEVLLTGAECEAEERAAGPSLGVS